RLASLCLRKYLLGFEEHLVQSEATGELDRALEVWDCSVGLTERGIPTTNVHQVGDPGLRREMSVLEVTPVLVERQLDLLLRCEVNQVDLSELTDVLLLSRRCEYEIRVARNIEQAEITEASRDVVERTVPFAIPSRELQRLIREPNRTVVLATEGCDVRPIVK